MRWHQQGGGVRPTYWVVVCVIGVLGAAPMWLAEFPPMVDLPQHGAQIAIGSSWEDPSAGYDGATYAEIYRINWLAPHLLPYWIVLLISKLAPIPLALRLIVSVAIAGVPIATAICLRVVRRESFGLLDFGWALVTLPVAYGFSFYWGFFNFVVALPVCLLILALLFCFARIEASEASAPRRRTVWVGGGFALSMNVLFLCHLLLFGYAGLVAVAVLACRWLQGPRSSARAVRLGWPLMASTPLFWTWVIANLGGPERSTLSVVGYLGLGWSRLLELPGLVVGDGGDLVGATMVLALVGLLLAGSRFSRDPARWAPLSIAALLYFLGPLTVMGTALVSPRFSFFFLPGILLAADSRTSQRSNGTPQTAWVLRLALVLTLVWMIVLGTRFRAYDRELGDFRALLQRAPAGQRLLYLAFDSDSDSVPQPVFLHLGSWYQVTRKGVSDFSFSTFFASRYRYRDEHRDSLYRGFEGSPQRFYWPRDGGDRYDLFLVRSKEPFDPTFFARAGGRVTLLESAPPYWLFGRSRELGDG